MRSNDLFFMELRRLIPFFDASVLQWSIHAKLLRWLTFLWLFVGLVILFSASYPVGNTDHGDGLYYLKRQLLSVLLGLPTTGLPLPLVSYGGNSMIASLLVAGLLIRVAREQ